MRGSSRRAVTVLTVLALAATSSACQWMSSGFDASGSADNSTETQINSSNVASLQVEWQASPPPGANEFGPMVASGNTLFTTSRVLHGNGPTTSILQAYSANGTTGCSGAPRVCSPLWTAPGPAMGSLMAVGGVVYVDAGGTLEAYDAAGVQNCSGSPVVCLPLWSGTGDGSSLIYEDGRVYAVNGSEIDAYATDGSSCSGSPVVCHPVATYDTDFCHTSTDQPCVVTALAADQDRLYAAVGDDEPFDTGVTGPSGQDIVIDAQYQFVAAYDLTGTRSDPLWTASTNAQAHGAFWPTATGLMDVGRHVYTSGDPTNVYSSFNGDFFGLSSFSGDGTTDWQSNNLSGPLAASTDAVFAFGAHGVVACGLALGCPGVTPHPLRSYATDFQPNQIAIGDDVLLVGDGPQLDAFDATGAKNCSGTPTVCTPLTQVTLPSNASQLTSVIVTNGRVYLTTTKSQLFAYDTP
jgi:hypothetical protein